MFGWLKWVRRDRGLAWLVVMDLLLMAVVAGALLLLLTPPAPKARPGTDFAVPGPPAPAETPSVGYDAFTPVVALPTVNPTQLVALPNQGQNNAPAPPPGLPGSNRLATPTPAVTSTPRR